MGTYSVYHGYCIAVLTAACCAIGCGWSASPAVQTTKPAGAPAAASMRTLETRGHRITLKAGGRYTIADKSGKVLAENVTLVELRKSDPALGRLLERAIAGREGVLDGRLESGRTGDAADRFVPLDAREER
jgi:hypothetical protein